MHEMDFPYVTIPRVTDDLVVKCHVLQARPQELRQKLFAMWKISLLRVQTS